MRAFTSFTPLLDRLIHWRPWRRRVDADITLIRDYLGGALSDRQIALVESRLVDDGRFFRRVWPIVEDWRTARRVAESPSAPKRAPGQVAGPLDPSYEPFLRQIGVSPEDFARIRDRGRTYLAAHPEAAIDLHGDARARAFERRKNVYRNLALGLLLFMIGYWYLQYWPMREWAEERRREVLEHRASSEWINEPRFIHTDARATKEEALDDGVRVFLSGDSRLAFEGHNVSLDGHAVFLIPQHAGPVIVRTSSARALLLAGRYAITSPPRAEPMRISVDSGLAHVWTSGQVDGSTVRRVEGRTSGLP